MFSKICRVFAVAWSVALVAAPAYPHHAAAAEFDVKRVIQLKGVLTKVENINPHSFMYIDVTGANGKVANWQLLMPGSTALRRIGFANRDLALGQTYSMVANPARDGSNSALVNEITFPNGRVFRLRFGPND